MSTTPTGPTDAHAGAPAGVRGSGAAGAEPRRVLYIASANFSGSTALCLLLNNHPSIVGVSQIADVADHTASGRGEPCTCGVHVSECEFWRQVSGRFSARTGATDDGTFSDGYTETFDTFVRPFALSACNSFLLVAGSRRLLSAATRAHPPLGWNLLAGRRSHDLLDAVREVAGKPIVADASKKAARAKTLYLLEPERVRVVWLVRDGRAVTWSNIVRGRGSVERCAWQWLRPNLEIALFLATLPSNRRILLRYESLCASPKRELDRIARLLGLPPGETALSLAKTSAHLVGGNPMRYRTEETALVLDDRWTREMRAAEVRRFSAVAGWLNRLLGYR